MALLFSLQTAAADARRRQRASVGLSDGRVSVQDLIDRANPNDVTYRHDTGVRYFHDGALVGILRSLRTRRVRGNLVLVEGEPADPDIYLIEPEWSGARVPLRESAAQFAIDLSMSGHHVIVETLLGFDTPRPQYLWKSETEAPAQDNDTYAILIPKGTGAEIMAMAFRKESGG